MDFEYCEKCGKRVPADRIDRGAGGYVGVDYYCESCLPPSAKTRVARSGSQGRRASVRDERSGRADRSSRESKATSRVAPGRGSRGNDYDDSPRRSSRGASQDRGASRRSGRDSYEMDRGSRRSSGRDSYASDDRAEAKKKQMMIFGGAIALVIVIIIIAVVAGSSNNAPQVATPPPTTAAILSDYASALSNAKTALDKARDMYARAKKLSDPKKQAKGIEAARDHVEKALVGLQVFIDKFDNEGKDLPKDLDKFLQDANEFVYLCNKSKPLDVMN